MKNFTLSFTLTNTNLLFGALPNALPGHLKSVGHADATALSLAVFAVCSVQKIHACTEEWHPEGGHPRPADIVVDVHPAIVALAPRSAELEPESGFGLRLVCPQVVVQETRRLFIHTLVDVLL